MFLIVSWILIGAAVGAVALAGIASTVSTGPRGDIGTAFVLLLIGLTLGAIGGGLLGRMFQRKFAGNSRALDLLAGGPWIAGVAVVLGIVMFAHVQEDARNPGMVRSDGGGLSLIYEIRLPPGAPAPPSAKSLLIELRTPEDVLEASTVRVRQERDRVMIQGNFWVTKATPKRVVAFRIDDGPTSLFTMHLAARPGDRGGRWSSWQGPDEGADSTRGKSPSAPPDETIEIRYAANY